MSDYSCYVTIVNQSNHALTVQQNANQGSWQDWCQSVPPQGNSGMLRLEDPSGPEGSSGGIGITVGGTGASVGASFGDPWGMSAQNWCEPGQSGLTPTMSWTFTGASGSPDNPEPNSVPGSGHPVYLVFTFTDTASN